MACCVSCWSWTAKRWCGAFRTIGYLHCGFEKTGEYRQYNQIIPYTDREDYLNSPGNNVAFALGAERLFGIEITERCKGVARHGV
jgi:NADH:ubiquinone oxidoreductase subunit D